MLLWMYVACSGILQANFEASWINGEVGDRGDNGGGGGSGGGGSGGGSSQ